MTKSNHKDDLTTKQAAQQLGLSNAADVRDLIKLNLLSGAYKDGGTWRIPQASIDTYRQLQTTKPSNAPKLWESFKSHPWIFWPMLLMSFLSAIALFIFAAISFGADFGDAQEQMYDWGIIHRFPPRHDGEILIVISTFNTGPGVPDSDIQNALHDRITKQINTLNLENVRVQIDKTIIPAYDREQAEKRAQTYDATMIIWGDDTDFQVQVNFLNLYDEPTYHLNETSIRETGCTSLATPPGYVEFVNRELTPQVTFLSFFATGNVLIGENNEAAIKVFTHILETYPTPLLLEFETSPGTIWLTLGHIYSTESNYPEAINSYDQAISVEPEFVCAYNDRGNIYLTQGNLDAALADYDMAIAIDPEFAHPYNNRGLIYAERRSFDLALSDFNQTIAYDPENALGYVNRGDVYFDLKNWEFALSDYNQAITYGFEDPAIYSNRGVALYQLGDFRLALDSFDHALTMKPELVTAYRNRGKVHLELGDIAAALADFNQAIMLDPEYANAYLDRGITYANLRQPDAALDDIRLYLELNPEASNRSEIEELIRELER